MKNISKLAVNLCKRLTPYQRTIHLSRFQVFYNYSSTPSLNPTLLKLQSGITTSEIDTTMQEVCNFSSEDHRKALRLLLEGVQSQKSPLEILFNQKFIEQTLRHPEIFIDCKTFLVMVLSNELTELMMLAEPDKKRIEQYLRIINQSYTECFQQLKSIEDEQVHLRYHIMLNKKYADFFVTYLSKYFPGEQKLLDFKKCTEVYRHHNQSIKQVLNELQTQIETKDHSNRQLKGEALRMIEIFAENVLFTNHIANEVFQITKNQSDLKKSRQEISQNIKEGLEFYRMVKDIDYLSQVYIHLRKNLADISYYLRMKAIQGDGESGPQKDKLSIVLSQDYNSIYQQSLADLEAQIRGQTSSQRAGDVCLSILNIYIQKLYNQTQLTHQQISQKITAQLQSVLLKIKNEVIRKECSVFLKQRVDYIVHYEGLKRQKKTDSDNQ